MNRQRDGQTNNRTDRHIKTDKQTYGWRCSQIDKVNRLIDGDIVKLTDRYVEGMMNDRSHRRMDGQTSG